MKQLMKRRERMGWMSLIGLVCLSSGWVYGQKQTGGGVGVMAASGAVSQAVVSAPQGPNFSQMSRVDELRWRCHQLAAKKLDYRFGGANPDKGGLDCSATVQHILKEMGVNDVPRTSFTQYQWLAQKGGLKKIRFWSSPKKAYAKMKPGDLVFWGKTYRSGNKVTHVMIYLGQNPKTGRQYMFGARGSKSKGHHGAGVDVFEMNPNSKSKLVAYGPIPGIRE
ncbi:MAG: C40 family peptidase [Verrucomicrobiales bacterium]|nr:C40 family peptidase [Verrucomicrobiales bacterium]